MVFVLASILLHVDIALAGPTTAASNPIEVSLAMTAGKEYCLVTFKSQKTNKHVFYGVVVICI